MRKFDRIEIFESLKEEMCLWTGLPSACLYLVPFGCVYRASISSLRTPIFGVLLDEPGERAGGVDSYFYQTLFPALYLPVSRFIYTPIRSPKKRM